MLHRKNLPSFAWLEGLAAVFLKDWHHILHMEKHSIEGAPEMCAECSFLTLLDMRVEEISAQSTWTVHLSNWRIPTPYPTWEDTVYVFLEQLGKWLEYIMTVYWNFDPTHWDPQYKSIVMCFLCSWEYSPLKIDFYWTVLKLIYRYIHFHIFLYFFIYYTYMFI